ncbi:hypothetical protein EKO27_g551 [Xylaria grammica]|uniref:Uncharacterized protein n=1 Tax=Xylaria grammica TaxID=363999 RepID=A0A439DJD0_9PEZI|nr:hypothetical protein EKO27_g551 [Xylaria grammica]
MASFEDLVVINPDGDAIITVLKHDGDDSLDPQQARFLVRHRVANSLKLSGDKYEIKVPNDDIVSIETIELLLWCIDDKSHGALMPDKFYAVSVEEIWRLLTLLENAAFEFCLPGRYEISSKILGDWFGTWFYYEYDHFTKTEYEQLLYPAFVIGNCRVFADVTAWLTYNVAGDIHEGNPLIKLKNDASFADYRGMHLPKPVVCAVREAKNVLRNKISRSLNGHWQNLSRTCSTCSQSFKGFHKDFLGPYDSVQDMVESNHLLVILNFVFRISEPKESAPCRHGEGREGNIRWMRAMVKNLAPEIPSNPSTERPSPDSK